MKVILQTREVPKWVEWSAGEQFSKIQTSESMNPSFCWAVFLSRAHADRGDA